jgi:DNA mismatch endonuclease (patch repair protein)
MEKVSYPPYNQLKRTKYAVKVCTPGISSMDRLTKAQRSYCMTRIRSKSTGPEMALIAQIRSLRLRGYRLHFDLPGKPDIYFQRARLAVFVDGCFWHGCPRCYVRPTTNRDFWTAKINRNRQRAKNVSVELRKKGIRIIRLWEHQIKKNPEKCAERMQRYLSSLNQGIPVQRDQRG